MNRAGNVTHWTGGGIHRDSDNGIKPNEVAGGDQVLGFTATLRLRMLKALMMKIKMMMMMLMI